MTLTTIIKLECKVCGKLAIESSRMVIGKTSIVKLQCGHIMPMEILVKEDSNYDNITFADGGSPREYQIEAIKFVEASGIKCIIGDEQGLGKTIEALMVLKLNASKTLPAVYVCPTTIKLQVMREILRICGNGKEFLTQVIQSGKEKAMPGFQIYIVTFDMLKKEDIFEYVPDIKTIIIDECHRIKNHNSDRAKAVQKIASKCDHILPMSGTSIKNHAGEYFTVLNLVAPTRFPHYQTYVDSFCANYTDSYGTKIGGLKNAARFHELTKDLIIRRTKAEVLKDLPPLDRKFFHVELDAKMNKAYAKALEELDELLYSDEGKSSFEQAGIMIEIMSRLRHITGISKVPDCVEFVTEFIESTTRKITIFTHHNDVAEILKIKLNSYFKENNLPEVLHLHSGLNGDQRPALVTKFETQANRVMIASTLAAGEGLNLQFCSDSVMLERQWNPANEEQAEARFHRFGQKNNVSVTYMLASGTIDEYFTELVERKRSIVAQILDNKETQWEQSSLMQELAQMLSVKGRGKWKL